MLGTFLGLALLAVLQNGLILLGVSSYWSPFFVGLVILISVSVHGASPRRERARTAAGVSRALRQPSFGSRQWPASAAP